MTARVGAAIVLGLFAAVSVAYVIVDEVKRGEAVALDVEIPEGDRLIVYYFYGNRRCKTCNAIESYSREAVADAFAQELRSGRVVWRTLNYEDPANAQFQERYGLYTSTLVLSDIREGAERDWYELDETWRLVGDKPAFLAYVQREARAVLEPEQ